MTGGFGCWWILSGFEPEYWREKWVGEHLGRDIEDPTKRAGWVCWQLGNLATEIENARRRDAAREVGDLAYYASRLRRELDAVQS
jgi:hypothetical protein